MQPVSGICFVFSGGQNSALISTPFSMDFRCPFSQFWKKNPNLQQKKIFFFEDWVFHSVNTHKLHGDILLQFNGNSMCNSMTWNLFFIHQAISPYHAGTRGVQYVMKTAQYIPKFYINTLRNYFNLKVCFLAKYM